MAKNETGHARKSFFGKRSVTTETALPLATYFGTSPGLWLNPQKNSTIFVRLNAKESTGSRKK